jgi:hypothetical protein
MDLRCLPLAMLSFVSIVLVYFYIVFEFRYVLSD